jgi:hypothetical protein
MDLVGIATIHRKNEQPLVKMSNPFGSEPNAGLPSGSFVVLETNVHAPTSCSLSVFCWATASVDDMANANTIMVSAPTILAQFIAPPCPLLSDRSHRARDATRPRMPHNV